MTKLFFDLRKLWYFHDLLWIWTLRDIKIRYKQSIMGIAWAILQPFSMMLIFTLIFSYFMKVPTKGVPYPIFSYTALLPWTFFAASISSGTPSIVSNSNLVTKIYFPREVLPFSAVMASFADFLFSSLFFILLILYYKVALTMKIIVLPLILVNQVILTFGVVLLASAINVKYRDIRFVIPLITQLWMYASPIIYPVSVVPQWLQPYYALNPMVGIIEGYRKCILYNQWPDFKYLAISTTLSVILFILSYRYFKGSEKKFADII